MKIVFNNKKLLFLMLSSCLIILLHFIPSSSSQVNVESILITEVYYDTYTPYDLDEYIRICNPTDFPVDISGWELTDLEDAIYFPQNTIINPKYSMFIVKNASAFYEETTLVADYEYGTDSLGHIPQMVGGIIQLVNTKDEVILKDSMGTIVDVIIYGESTYVGPGWVGTPVLKVMEGIILERDRNESTGLYVDTDSYTDWDDNRIYVVGQSHFEYETFGYTGEITVFSSPDSSFNVITNAIRKAKSSFYLNIYEFHSLELLEYVVDAAGRGLDVKVFIEGSPVGVRTENQELAKYVAQQIVNAGGRVRYIITDDSKGIYDRYKWNHAKYCILDNETVIVESENWKTTGIPVRSTGGNRGWGVTIVNKDIADFFLRVFSDDWKIISKDVIEFCDPKFPKYCKPDPSFSLEDLEIIYPADTYKVYFSNKTIYGTFKVSPVLAPDTSLMETKSILGMIKSANISIYVQQIYAHKHWAGSSEYWDSFSIKETDKNLYLEEVINAARRGVEVKILLGVPFSTDDSRNNYETMKYINEVAENENLNMVAQIVDKSVSTGTGFTKIHNKGVIVDGRIVLISSINWGENSPTNNREVGVIIENEDVASFFSKIFNFDWNPSDDTSPDMDNDGIPDFTDNDFDGDGVSNQEEIQRGTNPFDPSTPEIADLSSRYMSLLEVVIGAIFGVTASRLWRKRR
jgi:cardiolipin synthase